MNILSKFKNFEVKHEDILSPEDRENCEKIQSIYENTLSIYKKWYDIYRENSKSNDEHNYYGLKINDLSICEKIEALDNNLIWQIYNYFSSKYKVNLSPINLDKSAINYNYQDSTISTIPLNYKVCVDDVLRQLNGLSFEIMRIKQLKKELKYACKNEYSDIWNIEIKNNIVNFNNFIKFSKSTIWGTYLLKSVKNFPLLELALSLFEHKKEMNLIGFKLQTDISIAYINQSIKLNSQKIKSIKFFKNGRVDIKFSSPEIAREFITKWCGYPLNKIA